MTARKRHVLVETSYCAVMYEKPRAEAHGGALRPQCSAAGRYMDTEGRVVCARCAEGLVVTKLTEIPKLIDLVDRVAASEGPLTEELRAQLRGLVCRATKDLEPW